MIEIVHQYAFISTILLTGCLIMYASTRLLGTWLKIMMAIAVIGCGMLYTDFGKLDDIYPKDEAYKKKYGNQAKHVNLHWHEIYHYYLGAKYFRENGYQGLYESVAYADHESEDPTITAVGLRSLREPTFPITMEEGLRRGREEFRPRFTDERWESFNEDLHTLKSVAGRDWLDVGLFDAGYNPPPSWAVIGTTVANLIPISQKQPWGGDMRPEWYQMQVITLFDPLMLAIGIGFVTWAFGWLGAVAFIVFYCTNEPANYNWIAGSFFRYTWLAELMIGLSCLRKKHYMPAGIFMGLSAMDRIFPFAFLGAAGLGLLFEAYRGKAYRNVFTFGISAAAAVAIIGSISVLMFGMEAWHGFFEKILIHKDMYFVNHIGYRRIAVFGPEVTNQNFWWEPGLNSFRAWNAKLVAKWIAIRPIHLVLWAVMIASATFASFRARAEEAALMLGGLLFFFNEIAANYYYIYFPMVFVVLLSAPYSKMRQVIMAGYIVLWAMLWRSHFGATDELLSNYYKCWWFFGFFCLWVFGRAGESLLITLRERTNEPAKPVIA